MKKLVAVILTLVLALSLAACAAPAAEEAPAVEEAPAEEAVVEEAPAEEAAVKIGVILVHDENSGYDVAHIDGMEGAKAAHGLTDDQVIYKYNIPEDETCYDTAVDLVEQGCTL